MTGKRDVRTICVRASRSIPGSGFPAYETGASGIIWTMEYLDAYLVAEKRKTCRFLPDLSRPERFTDTDGEVETAFILIPARWLRRPQRLEAKLAGLIRRWPPRGLRWYENRLRAAHAERITHAQSLPGLFWMARFYREQPFRENLIVLLPGMEETEPARLQMRQEQWMREFLGENFGKLNGLLLVSSAIPESAGSLFLAENHAYYRHIYQDTGLPVIGVGRLPEYFRGKAPERTVCVDAGTETQVPFRSLPERTIYLDMTSDPEKERLLYAKRKDVCYRSLRMYLDTFVRKRYNTNRCKVERIRGRRQLPPGAFTVNEQERE